MKRRLAGWLRKWADRMDNYGAPKRTGFGFTIENGWGSVMNNTGRGCPLWYYGDDDYQLAHTAQAVPFEPAEIQWVTIGGHDPGGFTHVLGSAEVVEGTTTRRMNGYTEVKVPVRDKSMMPPNLRTAKVPNWEITLTCKLTSFVSLTGTSYQDAVTKMFGRSGTRG